jgi:hypothetical protein
VLRRICGRKRWEVTGGWRKLHSNELYNLYTFPNIISDQIKEDEVDWTWTARGWRIHLK